jgi:hypothetical protein
MIAAAAVVGHQEKQITKGTAGKRVSEVRTGVGSKRIASTTALNFR